MGNCKINVENDMHVFTIVREDGSSCTITAHQEATWTELTQEFVHYLRGCGFIFTDSAFVSRVQEMFGEGE